MTDEQPIALMPRPLALVTGASSGIGLELARQFARNGFDVVVVADEDAIRIAALELSVDGATAMPVQADLATQPGVERTLAEIRAMGRPVAAAALNAGVAAWGRFDEIALEDDLRVVALNVTSTVHLAKELTRRMVAEGAGRLLITSSVAATQPGPNYATYAASKAFLHSFAEALRAELADSGVVVTSLLPGPTDTDFFERAGMLATRVGRSTAKDDPEDVARQGFEALMKGRHKVVAGSRANKLQEAAGRLLPDTAKARVHALMTARSSRDGGRR